MKLTSFLVPGSDSVHIGVADTKAGVLLDLTSASPSEAAFLSMQALIEHGEPALARARSLAASRLGDPDACAPLASARLLAPVPVPIQMRDFSTFPGQIKNAPAGMARIAARMAGDEAAARNAKPLPEVPEAYRRQPIYYFTNRFSVVGPDAEIPWPRYSRLIDFELEFGIFLKAGGKNIAAGHAREHIFGYTIYNDFSARDQQCLEMRGMLGPTKGKSFDFGNAMGPWIVTADEIPNPYALRMAARVNGAVFAEGDSSGMVFDFEQILEYVSQDETLHAGEFFGSGTMGNGCGLEQDCFLNDGDVVELEVEGIGVLRNTVRMQGV
jgi:2-keto-4-pentenoate hydratase/2-oxohepta-3-ene-1,7-dioic acid hydratase in catechol pathway